MKTASRPSRAVFSLSFCILVLLTLSLSGPLYAATLDVCASGCGFTTIQEALDNAEEGDTINVLDAVHTEADVIFDSQGITTITIQGQGRDETIVQASESKGGSALPVLRVGSGKDVTIRDIHIRHGGFEAQGGALSCYQGSLTLLRVRVSDSTSRYGGGVFLWECDGSSFDDVIIENNRAWIRGGGLYVNAPGIATEVAVSNSLIRSNTADDDNPDTEPWEGDNSGGGIFLRGPEAVLRLHNSRVTDNRAVTAGGGLKADRGAELRVTDSSFSGNMAHWGGGLAGRDALVDLIGSTVSQNLAIYGGGGVIQEGFGEWRPSRLQLRNSTVSNNRAEDFAGAIGLYSQWGESVALILNSTVADNETADGGPERHAMTAWGAIGGDSQFIFANAAVSNPGLDNCGVIEAEGRARIRDFGSGVFSDATCGLQQNSSSDEEVVLVAGPRPFLDFDVTLDSNDDEDGSGDVSLGDTLTFRFAATNQGETGLTDVFVNVYYPWDLELDCDPPQPANLAVGELLECTASRQVSEEDLEFGLTLFAEAFSIETLGVSGDLVIPVQPAWLRLKVYVDGHVDTDSSGTITPGDALTLAFEAANGGSVALEGVLIEPFLDGLSELDCPEPQPADLSAGAAQVCTATYTVTGKDAQDGRVSVFAFAGSANPELFAFAVELVPVSALRTYLVLSAALEANADEDGSGDISEGDSLTFAFTARNAGETGLTGVVITPSLYGVSELDCSENQPADLAIRESLACTASYTVTSDDQNFNGLFLAAEASSNESGVAPDYIFVPVQAPGLIMSVTLQDLDDRDASNDVSAGDLLTFALTTTNWGNVTMVNVSIESFPGWPACDQPADLAPGESLACDLTYEVTGFETGKQITLLGLAEGFTAAPNSVVNADLKLGPLQDNGGPTMTHGFRFADSPAVDRHNDPDCGADTTSLTDVDQRGVSRPQGMACDSGAFELDPFDAVQSQVVIVAELLASGALNEGQANSLSKKLQEALDRLLSGKTKPAFNKLGAFINEVEDYIADGLIGAETGASMIATAQWVMDNA